VLSIVAKLACAGSAAALVCASVASAQTPAPPAADYTAAGSGVAVRYLGGSADDASTLSYRVGAFDGSATDWVTLFTNSGPGAPAVGTEFLLAGAGGNPLTAGSTVIFRLFNETRGFAFFSGAAARNADDATHVMMTAGSGQASRFGGAYTLAFNFEDLMGGTEAPASDWDYNDLRFEATNLAVTPEPATVALMGAGLLGLAAAARRRQVARRA
jgi:hypothetical protein